MAFSSAKASSLLLFLKVAFVFHLQGVTASGGATPSSTSSYQPTSGVEERWIAEEEFHGASSTESQRRIEQHKKKRGKDPQPSFPGQESLGEHSWWDDEDEHENDDEKLLLSKYPLSTMKEEKKNSGTKRHKLRVWKNDKIRKGIPSPSPVDESSLMPPSKGTIPENSPLSSEYDEEHPMRTDEWQLDVQLSRLFPKEEGDLFTECYTDRTGETPHAPKRRGSYRKRQVMQFARNGYMKILEDERSDASGKRNKLKVGKWRLGHSGVAFDIPVQVHVKKKKGCTDDNIISRTTVLHYYADIHLNKFGERPRMFRGVITRDRHSSFLPPSFLRPVIGTFSAEGIGRDTADTSYKERAISMSRQQVINEARK
mmetsp:Transcript_29472/g.62562  ORF Transcript_29472/g.62562 Transcript_29472/m.62562 type:complete len:370 (-) Transcript_29472:208-1317(-)|eukprot:CAMPEP_0172325950 /NCGR_PEP_ID=MMETSP1058-20130122/55135_1 /TAXON_ID=83371 /ORGANISM="Detonula confervacea, Strain CCMP 353" /LENGTH=369 /DNA_ID=CAMNT_0013042613 /DNA_START=65 /DNA_END=1174 /DNA_ORIENTATION=-